VQCKFCVIELVGQCQVVNSETDLIIRNSVCVHVTIGLYNR
jgi:hypothetical protein